MTIEQFLRQGTRALANVGIASARLDVLLLMEDALKRNRTWLLAHPGHIMAEPQMLELATALHRRSLRIPLAYIRGKVEFYGRNFTVTPHSLIPRPETEQMITALQTLTLPTSPTLLDVGTGSGAIAITAALEIPGLTVDASDVSPDALAVAAINAEQLDAPVRSFFVSDLLEQAGNYAVIAANLPYVAKEWARSPETTHEPALALFADDAGLALIKKLVEQAPAHLAANGHLLLEADPRQHAAIKKMATAHKFTLADQNEYILCFKK